MTPRFSIKVEPHRRLVRVKLAGFFQPHDFAPFAAARQAAHAELGVRSHLTLCDVSECKIQPQAVIEAFRGLLVDPQLKAERIAFVTGATTARMQIRRLITRDTARAFDTTAEAEAWLFAPAEGRAHV